MFKVLLLAVALVGFVSSAPADDKLTCAGCPQDQDINDPKLLTTLTSLLSSINSDKTVKNITSYRTQVVAGVKHYIGYETTDGSKCELSYVKQIWISDNAQFIKNNC